MSHHDRKREQAKRRKEERRRKWLGNRAVPRSSQNEPKLKSARAHVERVNDGEGWFRYLGIHDTGINLITVDVRIFSQFEEVIPDAMDVAEMLCSHYVLAVGGRKQVENPGLVEVFLRFNGKTVPVFFAVIDGVLFASCERFCEF